MTLLSYEQYSDSLISEIGLKSGIWVDNVANNVPFVFGGTGYVKKEAFEGGLIRGRIEILDR